jgi:aryl-alcohol dehydrogenase-like predicted oxidoreductase
VLARIRASRSLLLSVGFPFFREKGSTMTVIGRSDLDVFPLGLGGNTFGWTSDKETSFAVLDAYVAGGGNSVDSADSYSAWAPGNVGGESETIIGEWTRARGNRDSVIIATKVFSHPQFRGLSPKNVIAAAEASLARLQTDRIDLYYAHRDDPDVPVAEAAGAFHELQVAGKIRYVGLSNYTAPRVREWSAVAAAEGFAPPVAIQPLYNLVERAAYETSLAPVAAELGLGVLPYYGLAAGFLAGKYRSASDHAGAARQPGATRYLTSPTGPAVLAALDAISSERGVAQATVALAWLRTRPNVSAPLASARTVDQLPALLASATLDLTADEIQALDKAPAA